MTSARDRRSATAGDAQAAVTTAVQRGGEVQTRTAYWGTNGDQANWLALAGSHDDVPVPGR